MSIHPTRVRQILRYEGGRGDVKSGVTSIKLLPPFGHGETYYSYDSTVPEYCRTHTDATCYDHTNDKVNGHYTSGGSLIIDKTEYTSNPVQVSLSCQSAFQHCYEGKLYPVFLGIPSGYDKTAFLGEILTTNQMLGWGTKGWNRFRPGRPDAALSVFIGELRDLPRMLMERARDFRGLSGKGKLYLSYQFGWAPFVRDLCKMYNMYNRIEQTISNIRKNNGKWMLRTGSLSKTDRTTTWEYKGLSYFGFTPIPPSDCFDYSSSHVHGFATLSSKIWFSGRFRYYIPERDIESSQWKQSTIRKIYGLTITPDVVWELIPWSWLIDYFSSAGDLFANLSGGYVDAVAQYAYVMQECKLTQWQRSEFTDNNGKIISSSVSCDYTHKLRVPATPFGFGLTFDGFTGSQLAILGALGLSRSNF